MKKLFFLLLTAGLFMTLIANGQSSPWIKTVDGQVNCKKLTVHGKTANVVLENGEKSVVPVSTILSYYKDGMLYTKMPLYNKGVKGDLVFMEFVRTKEDMSLYKYDDSGNAKYFVYKGDEIYMELSDVNKSGFEKFFNIQL